MALFSPTVLEHFRHPRNRRRLEAADAQREVSNPVCGDRLRLQLRLAGGVVTEAAFVGDGCALSIAAASLLTEMLAGRSRAEAVAIREQELVTALDATVPPERMDCVRLPLRALHGALARTAGTDD